MYDVWSLQNGWSDFEELFRQSSADYLVKFGKDRINILVSWQLLAE